MAEFRARRGQRSRVEFWREVCKVTGMSISYSHLANILSGKRPPGEIVLQYLGIERVDGYRRVGG